MKLTAAVIAVVASSPFALAQSNPLAGLPACAQTCFTNALTTSAGGCAVTDLNCLCNSQTYTSAVTQCVIGACDSADAQTAAAQGQQICASAAKNAASSPTSTSSTVVTVTSTPISSVTKATSSSKSSAASMSSMSKSFTSSASASMSSSSSIVPPPNSGAHKVAAGGLVAGVLAVAIMAL